MEMMMMMMPMFYILCCKHMFTEGVSQSLVSSESGADETQNTKLLMRYLSLHGRGSCRRGKDVGKKVLEVMHKMVGLVLPGQADGCIQAVQPAADAIGITIEHEILFVKASETAEETKRRGSSQSKLSACFSHMLLTTMERNTQSKSIPIDRSFHTYVFGLLLCSDVLYNFVLYKLQWVLSVRDCKFYSLSYLIVITCAQRYPIKVNLMIISVCVIYLTIYSDTIFHFHVFSVLL